ncbi:NRDE family protein [Halorubrum rubrum]|uniref:NRDE family protein n=1 Tax=Halorubrum rubrum TaxID=1126240 RepID=A0ABD5R0U1_9EURY|nr:NRDE family protein [Halorubrum rubrum]
MCTLTLAWRVFPEVPVALAANRDESLSRVSEPPSLRGDERRFLAPRDAEAGGTWIGMNDAGVVVAVTNRWLEDGREGDRSRGLLVEDCLREPSAEAAARAVEREVTDREYDGFNLAVAADAAAFLLSYDGGLAVTRLDPGVHVVGNVGGVVNGEARFAIPDRRADFGAERAASVRRIASALVPEPGESGDGWLDRASDVLADHAYGACLHGDGYGTRSFTRIRTGSDPAMAFADGPPCETATESIAVPADFRTESQF